ncbi:MAG: pilin [Candidatus Pacebacteria bacterium]|nr:pilin [Candidatus Paceibacterota bacterium]
MKKLLSLTILFLGVAVIFGGVVLAQTNTYQQNTGTGGQNTYQQGSGASVSIPNPLGVNSIGDLIQRIINYLLIIGIPIATIMIFIGAFYLLTSAGDPERVTKGRQTIQWAVLGLAILLIGDGLIYVIQDIMGKK